MKSINRRNFIKKTSLSAASIYLATNASCSGLDERPSSGGSYMGDFAAPKLETVKIAIIGVGARGSGHARQLASIEGTEIEGKKIPGLGDPNVPDAMSVFLYRLSKQ